MKPHQFVLVVSVLLLVACSGETDESLDADSEKASSELAVNRKAPDIQARPAPTAVAEPNGDQPLLSAPRLKGEAESNDGSAMKMVIYANDRRSYQESLQLIAEQSTDAQFQQLDAAIRYLLINHRAIMNNEQRLFEFVDGKTGNEVLQATADLLNERDHTEG